MTLTDTFTDAGSLVVELNSLEQLLDAPEQVASDLRWDQSLLVMKALDAGMTQQEVADGWLKSDGTPYSRSHVARVKKTHVECYYSNNRPRWYDAWNGKGAHAQYNSGENEWYTPPAIIDAARDVLGTIDLDPATSAIANLTVQATVFYTKEDDGLSLPWSGRVWMNPPYAPELVWKFCEKLCEEYAADNVSAALVLVNNATETAWFQRMAELAAGICFPAKRVKFLDPDGNPGAPLQGQAILYFGENVEEFRARFVDFGFTVTL